MRLGIGRDGRTSVSLRAELLDESRREDARRYGDDGDRENHDDKADDPSQSVVMAQYMPVRTLSKASGCTACSTSYMSTLAAIVSNASTMKAAMIS